MTSPAGSSGPSPAVTEAFKRAALEQELAFRRKTYPARVAEGSMTREHAAHQIWILERIIAEGYRPQ
jgi:hypothetical protein